MPSQPRVHSAVRAAILAWYRAEGRTFPFRETRDPYAILVSEVMAQQTQIARATEAWSRFLVRFPSFAALAAATPADVLREWRGLGYNRRAVNLLRAARIVVDRHGGELPSDLAALRTLPGIGPYTARAVAALAFEVRVGAIDTNVRRVLGRVVVGTADVERARLQAIADASVPAADPGEWTHALMDVGATFCRPRPRCAACPAEPWCRYRRSHGRRGPAAGEGRGRPGPAEPRRGPREAFSSTSRWLRGRLLDRLRDAEPGTWVMLSDGVGEHGRDAVLAALRTLADDGLAELDPADPRRARLPAIDVREPVASATLP